MKTLLKITVLSVAMGGMLQADCVTANGCPTPCPVPVACPTVVLCPAPPLPPPPPPPVVVTCPTTYYVVEEVKVDCCVSACATSCYCCD